MDNYNLFKDCYLLMCLPDISIKNIENINDIEVTYKMSMEFKKSVKIFGKKFVDNNRNNCKIIYNNKNYELTEYFGDYNIQKNENVLRLILRKTDEISDMSYMFFGCSSLISILDLNDLYKIPNLINDEEMNLENNSSKYSDDSILELIIKCNEEESEETVYNLSIFESFFYNNNLRYINSMFSGCNSLISLPDISKWYTSEVDDMSYIFYDCNSLKSLPDISKWNTSKVNDMSYMFSGCNSLISLPDISKWNTSEVNDMSYMFSGCNSLISLPDISKWNTSEVNDMSYMFSGSNLLISLPDISYWNIYEVNNISYMFSDCNSLKSLPDISKWNTSKVNNMSYMFSDCNLLISLPDISKWNTSKVNNMSYMFSGCNSLISLPDISK